MHIGVKTLISIAAAVNLSLPFRVAADEMDAVTILTAMSSAMQTLNYEGTFIHTQNGHTDLMRILHSNDDMGEHERMTSLNGEAREVIRNNSLVTCIWPGTDDVQVNRSKPRKLLKSVDAALANSDVYNVTLRGAERVAGIMSDVVDVNPADQYRYGYRFWVDQESGMMLRSMVVDSNDTPLEELMFTDINYLNSVDPVRFEVDVDVDTTQWVDAPGSTLTATTAIEIDKVQFDSLPEGFVEQSESYRMMAVQKDNPVSHVVVSDGIATLSVYVEYIERSEHDPATLGATSMGALSAYGLSLPSALVTVVGEAPKETVEVIARATRIN